MSKQRWRRPQRLRPRSAQDQEKQAPGHHGVGLGLPSPRTAEGATAEEGAAQPAEGALSPEGEEEMEEEAKEEEQTRQQGHPLAPPPLNVCFPWVFYTCIFWLNGCGTKRSCVSGRKLSFVLCGEVVRVPQGGPENHRDPEPANEVQIQSKVNEQQMTG